MEEVLGEEAPLEEPETESEPKGKLSNINGANSMAPEGADIGLAKLARYAMQSIESNTKLDVRSFDTSGVKKDLAAVKGMTGTTTNNTRTGGVKG
jgi:hypothetical protein